MIIYRTNLDKNSIFPHRLYCGKTIRWTSNILDAVEFNEQDLRVALSAYYYMGFVVNTSSLEEALIYSVMEE